MSHPVTCGACSASFKLPDELWQKRVAGRVVTLKCKKCKEPIDVDGRTPEQKQAEEATPEQAAPEQAAPEQAARPDAKGDTAAEESRGEAKKPDASSAASIDPQPEQAQTRNEKPAGKPAPTTPAEPMAKPAPARAAAKPASPAAPKPAASPAMKATAEAARPLATPSPAGVLPRRTQASSPGLTTSSVESPRPRKSTGEQVDASWGSWPAPPDAAQAPRKPQPTTPRPAEVERRSRPGGDVPVSNEIFLVSVSDDDDRELSVKQIAAELRRGSVDADTIVWNESLPDWTPLGDVPVLARLLSAAPAGRKSGADLTPRAPSAAGASSELKRPALASSSELKRPALASSPELKRPPLPSSPELKRPPLPSSPELKRPPLPSSPELKRPPLPSSPELKRPPLTASSSAKAVEPSAEQPNPFVEELMRDSLDEVVTSVTPEVLERISRTPAEPEAERPLPKAAPLPAAVAPKAPAKDAPVAKAPAASLSSEPSRAAQSPSLPPDLRSGRRGWIWLVVVAAIVVLAWLFLGGGLKQLSSTPPDPTPSSAPIAPLPSPPSTGERAAEAMPAADTAQAQTVPASSAGLSLAEAVAQGTDAKPPEAFDKEVAKKALEDAAGQARSCRHKGDPQGTAQALVLFDNTGYVKSARVSGRYAGTATGICITEAMQRARMPRFIGPATALALPVPVR